MPPAEADSLTDQFFEFLSVDHNLHSLTTKNVRWTHKDWKIEFFCQL